MYTALKLSAFLLITGAISSSVSGQSNLPPPDSTQLTVRNVTYSGNSCPPGSAGSYISAGDAPNPVHMHIILDDFRIFVGAGPVSSNRRECNMSVDVSLPTGYKIQLKSEKFQSFQDFDNKDITYRFRDVVYYGSGTEQVS